MTSLQLRRAASAGNVHTDPAAPESAGAPQPPLFFLLWFSVLTRTGFVLKSSPDSLMWLLSFGTLRESVSEPRECKTVLESTGNTLKTCTRL